MAIRYLSGVNIDTNTFFVDSTNNKVGIGTGTPSAKLDIDGAHVASIGLLRLNSSAANMSAMTYYIDGVYKAATYAGTDDNFYVWGRDADIVFNTTTSGTTRMVITNGGNVGIGTTGPTQKLMVGGSIRVTGGYYDSSNSIGSNGQVLASTGTGTAWINVGGGTVNGSGTVNYLSKWTGTTLLGDSLIYDNGTNIGIGTTAPGQKVDVVGAAATDTYLRVLGGAGTTKGGIIVGNNDSGKNYGSLFFDNANNNVYLYQQYSSGDLVLGTNTNEKMRITSGGNVGIGNTSPSQKLHVEGNIRVTGAYYDSANGAGSSGQVLSSTGSGTSWITPFSGSGTTNYVAKWTSGTAIGNSQIFDNGTNVGVGTAAPNNKLSVIGNIEIQSGGSKIGFNVNDAFSAYGTSVAHYGISYGLTANPLALSGYFGVGVFTSGTERMRIDGSGNVGIGTTSPSRLLHVAGNAQVDGWLYQGGYYTGSVTLPYPGANYGNGRIYLRLCSSASGRIMTAKVRISSTWNWAPAFGSVEADISFYWNGSSLVYSYVNILSATGQAATNLTFGALEVEGGSISVPVYSTNSNPIYAYIQLSPDADPSQVSYSTWSSVAFPGQANVYIQTNLGVGTPSPGYRLDVNGTFHAGGDATFNGTNTYINSSYIYVGNNTADLVSISGNTVYLPGDGNVGIGNTSPSQKLHVTGNVRVTGAYYDSSNAAGTSGQILSSTGTGTAWISPGGGGGIITGSGTTNYVTKWTSGTAVGDSSIFDNGTNVGVGTPTPVAKLDVNGTFSLLAGAGGYWLKGEQGNSTPGGNSPFLALVNNNSIASATYGWLFYDSNADGSFNLYRRNNSTTSDQVLTISRSTGNVGIGTTTPQKPLEVISGVNDFVSVGVNQISVGNWTGIHFGYREANSSYRKSAIVFERTDLTANDAQGKIHILNGPQGSGGSATLADAKLTIAENGNVGIGTTSPSTRLEVLGDTGVITIRTSYPADLSQRGALLWKDATNITGAIDTRYDGTTVDMYFGSLYSSGYNSTTRMVIKGNGNVGIGTTAPESLLHLSQASTGGDGAFLFIDNPASSTLGNTAGIRFATNAGASFSGYGSFIQAVNTNAGNGAESLTFGTWNGAARGERMRIDSSGSVGINTTNPAYKLDVIGSIRSYGGLISNGYHADTYIENLLPAANNGAGQGDVQLRMWCSEPGITWSWAGFGYNVKNDGASPYGFGRVNTSFGQAYMRMSTDGDWYFYNANTSGTRVTTMTLTNAGNVGIGTTAPANKLVAVSDAIFNDENSYAIAAAAASDPAYKTVIGYSYSNDIGVIAAVRTSIGWRNISIPQGSLGIGTLSPSEKLHISGNIRVTGAYYDSANSAGTSGQILSSTGTGTAWIAAPSGGGVSGSGTTNYITKWTSGSAVGNSSIYDNGYVGIGTTAPAVPFEIVVNSSVGVTGNVYFLSRFLQDKVNYRGPFFGYDTSGSIAVIGAETAGPASSLAFYTYSGGWGERMRISGTNVGIGTTSPNEKLHVFGTIEVSGFQSIGNGPLTMLKSSYAGGAFCQVKLLSYNPNNASDADFGLQVMDSGGTLNEAIRVVGNTLNVGIGTTAPLKRLVVTTGNNTNSSSNKSDALAYFGGGNDNPNAQNISFPNPSITDGSIPGMAWWSADVMFGRYKNEAFWSIKETHGGALGGSQRDIIRSYFYDSGGYSYIDKTVIPNGNVGIGTTAPAAKLDVVGVIRYGNNSSSIGALSYGTGVVTLEASSANTHVSIIPSGTGNVGVATLSPAYKLDVSGTIRATGDVIAYSDARVKENVETLDGALDKVMKMRGVSYNKIGEQEKKVGVIAQEILEVLPEVVSQDETGTYSVAYGNISAVLIEAIKELTNTVKEQQKQIDELKSKLK